jgi:hypothetical protein
MPVVPIVYLYNYLVAMLQLVINTDVLIEHDWNSVRPLGGAIISPKKNLKIVISYKNVRYFMIIIL